MVFSHSHFLMVLYLSQFLVVIILYVRIHNVTKTWHSANFENALQVFNEPKWKLEVVEQYFWKYMGKVSDTHKKLTR